MKTKKKWTYALGTIALLIVLSGLIYTGPQRQLRKLAKEKTKAEITLIISAIKVYASQYGFPHTTDYSGELDFAEYFSKTLPNPGSSSTTKRTMILDFKKHEIYTDNNDYNLANATSTKILDPYEQPYIYLFDSKKKTFLVFSLGLDGEADIPKGNINLPESYISSSEANKDNITSID